MLDIVQTRGNNARVETASRNQIRLILDDLRTGKEDAFREKVAAIYTRHAASGRLRSGSTVTAALQAAKDLAANVIATAVDQVAPVAKDVEAFAMICVTVESYLSNLTAELDAVAIMASGKPDALSKQDSVRIATKREFESLRTALTRRLEIHRFAFTQSSQRSVSLEQNSDAPVRRKGGRPPAEFWDDMWATIAASLYDGGLKPKSQADVERAMTDWIEGQGFSAAVSTIRARARRLWDQIALPGE